jgi:hypothetical protein
MKATYTNSTAAFSAEPTQRRASRFCGRSVMGRAVKASGSGVNVPFAPLPSRQCRMANTAGRNQLRERREGRSRRNRSPIRCPREDGSRQPEDAPAIADSSTYKDPSDRRSSPKPFQRSDDQYGYPKARGNCCTSAKALPSGERSKEPPLPRLVARVAACPNPTRGLTPTGVDTGGPVPAGWRGVYSRPGGSAGFVMQEA